MQCPGFQHLIDFLDGRLAPGDDARMREHVAGGCGQCLENRRWYELLRSAARGDPAFEPPPWARNQAVAMFSGRRKVKAAARAAGLLFDSLRQPALAGVRSSEPAQRQMIYRAEGYSIDLQIACSPESGAELMGQILREGESGFASVAGLFVDLTRGRETIWSTVTNKIGEFMMRGIESGKYDLRIDATEATIKVTGLPISFPS